MRKRDFGRRVVFLLGASLWARLLLLEQIFILPQLELAHLITLKSMDLIQFDIYRQWPLPSFLLDAFRLTWMDKPVLLQKVCFVLINKTNKLKLKNESISVGSHPLWSIHLDNKHWNWKTPKEGIKIDIKWSPKIIYLSWFLL